jgi:hypothetical protein
MSPDVLADLTFVAGFALALLLVIGLPSFLVWRARRRAREQREQLLDSVYNNRMRRDRGE